MTFIEENDQTEARREHLQALRAALSTDAYPNRFARSSVVAPPQPDTVSAVFEKFKHFAPKTESGVRPTPEQHDAANQELNKIIVAVAGRLAVPPRVMGKAAFVHLTDGVTRLQVYVRKDSSRVTVSGLAVEADAWEIFNLLDQGDFIGVRGYLFATKTGELSIHVEEFEFLAKALVPMPDKLHGIADPEIRQRRRYADLLAGSLKIELEADDEPHALTTREVFERRARLVRAMRNFLDERGYIEVETPMLAPIASGAAARPFVTHHNALDITLYARIAPELYLKRLLVGGFERVYELNRNFRNEGLSIRHNPEFTMLEFYAAYMDVGEMMTTCEQILRESLRQAIGDNLNVKWDEHAIDFNRFERLTMKQAIVRFMPNEMRALSYEGSVESFDESWFDEAQRVRALALFLKDYETHSDVPLADDAESRARRQAVLEEAWAQYRQGAGEAEETADEIILDDLSREAETANFIQQIFELIAEPELIQPTFITDFPKAVSPLAKASPTNPAIAERFELYVGGMEIANGFSELNDPFEQQARFMEQLAARERGDEEAMPLDADYLRALAYGMPPAAGIGIGIDRVVMLATNRRSIRDVILFPHLRPETKSELETKSDAETKLEIEHGRAAT